MKSVLAGGAFRGAHSDEKCTEDVTLDCLFVRNFQWLCWCHMHGAYDQSDRPAQPNLCMQSLL
jgi:hypothetical protein